MTCTVHAFDALPEFVIEKLEANPRLLSKRTAADIKSELGATTAEQNELALSALKEAIDLLEAGKLDPSKIASFISQKLNPKNEADSGTTDHCLATTSKSGAFQSQPNCHHPNFHSRAQR